jgi:type II secretory pathway component PulF
VRRAMAYPMFLAVVGFGTIFFMVTFLVPKLKRIYESGSQALPLSTRMLIGVSDWMQNYWAWMFLIILIFVYIFRQIARQYLGQIFFDHLKLKIPFFKRYFVEIEFARFSRTLEMCLSSGLNFLESLRVATVSVDNALLRTVLENCYQRIEKGDTFGHALKQQPAFSSLTVQLVSIGEEAGHLTEVLAELSDSYEKDINEMVSYLTTLLEPMMILIMGAVIGFMVISMLLPVFELSATV